MASYKPVGVDEDGLLPPRVMGALDDRYLQRDNVKLFVEDFREPGDSSDDLAWQRAVNQAKGYGGSQDVVIEGTRNDYVFASSVNYRGLKRTTLLGKSVGKTTISGRGSVGSAFSAAAGPASPGPDHSEISAFGDSLTAGDAWLNVLATEGNATVFDGGQAGQSSTEIAFRMGALKLSVRFVNDQILTNGIGVISTLTPASHWRYTSVQWRVKASVRDITGTDHQGVFLFRNSAEPNARFQMDTPPASPIVFGTSVPVTVLEDDVNKSGVGHEADNVVYWSGRNTVLEDAGAVEVADQAFDSVFTGRKLVIGITNGTTEVAGTIAYNKIEAANEKKRKLFGPAYWDPRPWLVHEAIYAMGLTPTAEGLDKMSKNAPPPSIMSDSIHPSQAASTALGYEITRQARIRGLVDLSDDNTNDIVFRNFSFDGGMTSYPQAGIFDRYQDRIWGPDRLSAAIRASGNLVPTETASPAVDGIHIIDCEFLGMYTLPVLLRGVSNVVMRDCYVWRSLDTGFTFCKSLQFLNNRIEWSADNGVSLSRGCSQFVCVGNTIEGSYYAGIHAGGFDGDAGPSHGVITGNTVLNSRQYGISAIDGSSQITISDNVVDGVLRGAPSSDRDSMGDGAPVAYGTGIIVGGYMSRETTESANVLFWGEDFIISSNIIRNADRDGISVRGGARRVNIIGNQVVNIGSLFATNGTTPIPANHNYYSVGIGIYALSSTYIEDVSVIGNQVIDTRTSPRIGRSYFLGNSGVATGNYDSNVRTPLSSALVLRGSGAVSRSIQFGVGREPIDFTIRQSASRLLQIVGSLGGSDSTALQITRDGSIFFPSMETITGVSPNLYLTNAGEIRKIV